MHTQTNTHRQADMHEHTYTHTYTSQNNNMHINIQTYSQLEKISAQGKGEEEGYPIYYIIITTLYAPNFLSFGLNT